MEYPESQYLTFERLNLANRRTSVLVREIEAKRRDAGCRPVVRTLASIRLLPGQGHGLQPAVHEGHRRPN